MSRVQTRAFEPDDAEAAAVARAEVAAMLADGASGAVAVQDGETTGYLLGRHRDQHTSGPNLWVEAAGHAVHDAETVRDLYAAAAPSWLERGTSWSSTRVASSAPRRRAPW